MSNLRTCLGMTRISCWHILTHPKGYLHSIIFLALSTAIFSGIWSACALQGSITHTEEKGLLSYIIANQWLLLSIPSAIDRIETVLQKHHYRTPLPCSFIGVLLGEQIGALLAHLLLLLPIVFLLLGNIHHSLPSLIELGQLLLLSVGAGTVIVLWQITLTLLPLPKKTLEPILWLFQKMLFIGGGLLCPLSCYPLWLQKLTFYTPFPYILGERSSLLFFTSSQIPLLVFAYLGWGSISLGLLWYLYQRPQRRMLLCS